MPLELPVKALSDHPTGESDGLGGLHSRAPGVDVRDRIWAVDRENYVWSAPLSRSPEPLDREAAACVTSAGAGVVAACCRSSELWLFTRRGITAFGPLSGASRAIPLRGVDPRRVRAAAVVAPSRAPPQHGRPSARFSERVIVCAAGALHEVAADGVTRRIVTPGVGGDVRNVCTLPNGSLVLVTADAVHLAPSGVSTTSSAEACSTIARGRFSECNHATAFGTWGLVALLDRRGTMWVVDTAAGSVSLAQVHGMAAAGEEAAEEAEEAVDGEEGGDVKRSGGGGSAPALRGIVARRGTLVGVTDHAVVHLAHSASPDAGGGHVFTAAHTVHDAPWSHTKIVRVASPTAPCGSSAEGGSTVGRAEVPCASEAHLLSITDNGAVAAVSGGDIERAALLSPPGTVRGARVLLSLPDRPGLLAVTEQGLLHVSRAHPLASLSMERVAGAATSSSREAERFRWESVTSAAAGPGGRLFLRSEDGSLALSNLGGAVGPLHLPPSWGPCAAVVGTAGGEAVLFATAAGFAAARACAHTDPRGALEVEHVACSPEPDKTLLARAQAGWLDSSGTLVLAVPSGAGGPAVQCHRFTISAGPKCLRNARRYAASAVTAAAALAERRSAHVAATSLYEAAVGAVPPGGVRTGYEPQEDGAATPEAGAAAGPARGRPAAGRAGSNAAAGLPQAASTWMRVSPSLLLPSPPAQHQSSAPDGVPLRASDLLLLHAATGASAVVPALVAPRGGATPTQPLATAAKIAAARRSGEWVRALRRLGRHQEVEEYLQGEEARRRGARQQGEKGGEEEADGDGEEEEEDEGGNGAERGVGPSSGGGDEATWAGTAKLVSQLKAPVLGGVPTLRSGGTLRKASDGGLRSPLLDVCRMEHAVFGVCADGSLVRASLSESPEWMQASCAPLPLPPAPGSAGVKDARALLTAPEGRSLLLATCGPDGVQAVRVDAWGSTGEAVALPAASSLRGLASIGREAFIATEQGFHRLALGPGLALFHVGCETAWTPADDAATVPWGSVAGLASLRGRLYAITSDGSLCEYAPPPLKTVVEYCQLAGVRHSSHSPGAAAVGGASSAGSENGNSGAQSKGSGDQASEGQPASGPEDDDGRSSDNRGPGSSADDLTALATGLGQAGAVDAAAVRQARLRVLLASLQRVELSASYSVPRLRRILRGLQGCDGERRPLFSAHAGRLLLVDADAGRGVEVVAPSAWLPSELLPADAVSTGCQRPLDVAVNTAVSKVGARAADELLLIPLSGLQDVLPRPDCGVAAARPGTAGPEGDEAGRRASGEGEGGGAAGAVPHNGGGAGVVAAEEVENADEGGEGDPDESEGEEEGEDEDGTDAAPGVALPVALSDNDVAYAGAAPHVVWGRPREGLVWLAHGRISLVTPGRVAVTTPLVREIGTLFPSITALWSAASAKSSRPGRCLPLLPWSGDARRPAEAERAAEATAPSLIMVPAGDRVHCVGGG